MVFRCKKCGKKTISFDKGDSVGICSSCGAKQILPKTSSDKLLDSFDKANNLLIDGDFKGAKKLYKEIMSEDKTHVEAYWGLILCKYCVGYVKIGDDYECACICPESAFKSVKDDENFKKAIKYYADKEQENILTTEADEINERIEKISDIISSEKPYDVFISYKQSDNDEPTKDSKEAEAIYNQLTKNKLKVFYAPKTLGGHNKIGLDFLISILAAVNRAKVMIVIGSEHDYFNSEWVKAEWARFKALQELDSTKRLIPCYMNMEADDLPDKLVSKEAMDITDTSEKFKLVSIVSNLFSQKQNKNNKKNRVSRERIIKFLIPAVAVLTAVCIISCSVNYAIIPFYKKYYSYKKNCIKYLSTVIDTLPVDTVSAGLGYTVGLETGGTVVATKYKGENHYYNGQCDVSKWTDIVAVSAGWEYTVGLKSDGTVVATKYYKDYDYNGQCDVSNWTDIVAVAAGIRHTVGLKSDGTVVATEYKGDYYYGQCDVSNWTDIVAVSAGERHTVGLKSDGTVVATDGYDFGQCKVSDWKDIVAVSAGNLHTVGLKSDGTVVAVGDNDHDYGQCNVSDWTDIVAVSAGGLHTVGLKSDGTVVAVGSNGSGQCDVSDWTDIVAVSAGGFQTFGLKSDGTVVATKYNSVESGYDYWGQCDVSDWKDIKTTK